ncbi:MAG: response regulator [Bacteroidales bacterium]|nr:response regulator [Bacteroidales bacterium]
MSKIATILYVDDEPLNLKLFAINFQKKYNVLTALSGEEGLAVLEHNPQINVVISDMRMPEMDGLEFVQRARRNYPNVVYFILTGYDISAEIAQAIRDKLINKYFSKPFNIVEIDESIRGVLATNG